MKDTASLVASLTAVTPMFLGGAEHEVSGFRLTAFKGALRFWWRALAYPRLLQGGRDNRQALKELQERERRLFGAAVSADQPRSGQSQVRLCTLPDSEPIRFFASGDKLVKAETMPGACYLGYGLMGAYGRKGGFLTRSALAPGNRFRVEIRISSDDEFDERADVGRALRMMGLMGGLGSRVRRGWGSLALEALEGDVDEEGNAHPFEPPATAEAYREAVASLAGNLEHKHSPHLPPFTAFSGFSRVDIAATGSDPLVLLDRVGRQMQLYRAWGFKGRVNGQASERRFQDDHDWFKDAVKGDMRAHAPRRAAFGLPHNYYSAEERRGANVDPDGRSRRASPLAIHIHRLDERSYVAVLALLPAVFLPKTNRLSMKVGGKPTTAVLGDGWLDTLHGFIDGTSKASGEAYFPKRIPVIEPGMRKLPARGGGGP